MPKIIDYPRASFKNSLELAKAVSDLGGSCTKETCADHMKRKLSGGFTALIGAASKFGLIKAESGNLKITKLYKDYELSYTEDEKTTYLTKAFFNIPVFKKVYETYKDKKLQTKIFDKILIREFKVEEKMASQVKGYFIEAAKMVNLLNADDSFNQLNSNDETSSNNGQTVMPETTEKEDKTFPKQNIIPNGNNYVINITGPAISQTIEVIEEDHLDLVDAVIGIIRKKLSQKKDETD
jgi:hypothetical protein